MRRKTYMVLFEPQEAMMEIANHPTLWRSFCYMFIGIGAFLGVAVNYMFPEQYISVRLAMVLGLLVIKIVGLGIFACFLHGLIDAYGDNGGNICGLLSLVGFTTLPFLVFTPFLLLSLRMGGWSLLGIPFTVMAAYFWMVYLLTRAVEAVYLISYSRAVGIVLFAFMLWCLVVFGPAYFIAKMIAFSVF